MGREPEYGPAARQRIYPRSGEPQRGRCEAGRTAAGSGRVVAGEPQVRGAEVVDLAVLGAVLGDPVDDEELGLALERDERVMPGATRSSRPAWPRP
jgi:hypothetical protein